MINQEKIQEIQILEQNLQNVLFQKQAFQLELNEIDAAMEELEKTEDEVYKITGQILIKTDKNSLKKELQDKKKIFELRISSIEKQEKAINDKIDKIRAEFHDNTGKKK